MISEKQRADARSAVVKTYHEHLGGPPVPISYLHACADAAIEAALKTVNSVALKELDWKRGISTGWAETITGHYEVMLMMGGKWRFLYKKPGKTASVAMSDHEKREEAEAAAQLLHYGIAVGALAADKHNSEKSDECRTVGNLSEKSRTELE